MQTINTLKLKQCYLMRNQLKKSTKPLNQHIDLISRSYEYQ